MDESLIGVEGHLQVGAARRLGEQRLDLLMAAGEQLAVQPIEDRPGAVLNSRKRSGT
jgi:hypothetical protein